MTKGKIFIGSSKESLNGLRDIAAWLEEFGFEPLPWDEPALFMPGENTFLRLIQIAKEVNAAIFIFGEDDQVWYRADAMMQPRDNVLVEYGLFVGVLGPKRAIICRKGKPKTATDLLGITFIDFDQDKKHGAKLRLSMWAQNLDKQLEDPVVTQLTLQRDILRQEKTELSDRLSFEEQKSRDLEKLLQQVGGVDFTTYDFSTDGHWKLLFDYDYFWGCIREIKSGYSTLDLWMMHLSKIDDVGNSIKSKIGWDKLDISTAIAKTFRFLRIYDSRSGFQKLIGQLDERTRTNIINLANQRVQQIYLGASNKEL